MANCRTGLRGPQSRPSIRSGKCCAGTSSAALPITRGTKVLGRLAAGGELTTLGGVAVLCNCSEGRIATVATALGLIEPLAYDAPRSTIVPKVIETPLVAFFQSSCETAEARRRLCVSGVLFKELLARDFIRQAFPLNGLTIPARYYLADIDRFLAGLHQEAPLTDKIPAGCETILRAIRKCWRPQVEIFAGLLRRDIKAVGRLRHAHGVRQIVVNIDNVNDKLRRCADETRMTSVEAAYYLGIRPKTVGFLRTHGWLTETRKRTSTLKVIAFEREDLDQFRAHHVGAAELARVPNPPTHPVRVHKKLRQAGVVPVIQGAQDIEPFYRRSKAEAVIREAFHPSRRRKRNACYEQRTSPSGRGHSGLS